MNALDLQDRIRGCLLGLACADAVGAAVEFSPRGSFTPLRSSEIDRIVQSLAASRPPDP